MTRVAQVLGAAFLVWVLSHANKIRRYFKIRRAVAQLPGPAPHNLLVGNLPDLPSRGAQMPYLIKLLDSVGHLGSFSFYLGPLPVISVISPEHARLVLSSSKHSVKSSLYDFLLPWLGTGLLTSDGAKWKSRRRLITPAFHFDILKRFLEVMNEQSGVLVEKMAEKARQGPVEAFELIGLCALDIICETAMGKKINAQLSEGKNEYVEAVLKSSKNITDRAENPLLMPDLFFSLSSVGRDQSRVLKVLHGFTLKVIQERKALLGREREAEAKENQGKSRPAFLDILLGAEVDGKPLSDDDIREEVDTFMFEGHDTTSASMAWTMYLIGHHPEIQKTLHQEVDTVLGDSDEVTFEMLGELKYLDMVLKESLRLYPSVPYIGRQLTEDIVLDGFTIPEGTTMSIEIFMILHHPKYWPDPEKFIPERWAAAADGGEEKDPYLYIPFSAGTRNCVGQKFAQNEEKVILAKVLKKFQWKSLEENIPMLPELVMRPEKVLLEISLRN